MFSAAALIALLWPVWATVGPVGWTMYAPVDQDVVDGIVAEFARHDRSGWARLGPWSLAPVVVAAGAIAVAAWGRAPGRGVAAGLGALILACAIVVAVVGLDPPPVRLDDPSENLDPDVAPRVATWAPAAALIALAALALALALTVADRRRPLGRGAPLLAVAAVLLVGALALPWSSGLFPAPGAGERGAPTLGWLTAPLVVTALTLVATAARPRRRAAMAALAALLVACAVIAVAKTPDDGTFAGPWVALAGCALGLAGAVRTVRSGEKTDAVGKTDQTGPHVSFG